jgi:hypothetical protein
MRADVSGTFTVLLDPATSTGKLLALDDQLVNLFSILAPPHNPMLQPIPPEANSGIIPSWTSFYSPPLDGSLETLGDTLVLTSSGYHPASNVAIAVLPPFTITMQGNRATFNMHVPIIDYDIVVTGAQAVQVTPEPSSFLLALSCQILLGATRLRQRRPAKFFPSQCRGAR